MSFRGYIDPNLADDSGLAYGSLPEDDDYHAYLANNVQQQQQQHQPSEQELLIAQRAMDRIRRAKLIGQPNVSLSHEELEALDLHRLIPKEPSPERSSPKAKSKPKPGGKNAARERKAPAAPSSIFAATKSPKSGRKRSSTMERSSPPAPRPPGLALPGPGGVSLHAPFGYERTPPPQTRTTRSPSISRPSSRSPSSSSHSSFVNAMVAAYEPPGSFPSQFPSQSPRRPPSSSSRHSDAERALRSRSRSSSAASFSQNSPVPPYPADPFNGVPVLQPQASHLNGRRRVSSGSSDHSYSSIRRVPVGSKTRLGPSSSDPTLLSSVPGGYRSSMLHNELGDDDDFDEDNQGVRLVDVPEFGGQGYGVQDKSGGSSNGVSGNDKGHGKKGGSGKGKHRKGKK